jgi:hypothetical protein
MPIKFTSVLTTTALLTLNFISPAPVAKAEDTQLVAIQVAKIFVPTGFDDNDEIQVVLDGQLPDGCHRLAHSEIKRDAGSDSIVAVQWARKFPGQCPIVFVDFSTVVNLGRLPAGDYEISSPGLQARPLSIEAAPSDGQDNYIYANLESVYVESGDGPVFKAELTGSMTNSCLKWQDIKVLDQGDVLVILPILSYEDNGNCQSISEPFTKLVPLPGALPDGRNLVHVRSMNGQSVNHVFEVVTR